MTGLELSSVFEFAEHFLPSDRKVDPESDVGYGPFLASPCCSPEHSPTSATRGKPYGRRDARGRLSSFGE